MVKYNATTLSIATWNVNGLASRSYNNCTDEDFCAEIRKHDLVCLIETHMGPSHSANIEGYHPIPRYRKKCNANNRYYGGMMLYIKQEIRGGVTIVNKEDSETIWIKLGKGFFKLQEDVFVGFIYVVPKQPCHTDTYLDDRFSVIEREIQEFKNKGRVLIMGDLNARTACKEDFIKKLLWQTPSR